MTDRKHVEQYGVRDALASAELLRARDKGHYDPRPASGRRIAQRVRIICGRCGNELGQIVDFEHRPLFHSERTRRWTRHPIDLKCTCYGGGEAFVVDLDVLNAALEKARSRGRAVYQAIGDAPKPEDDQVSSSALES